MAAAVALPWAFRHIYFRDYAILMEGGLRAAHGLRAYRDFGIPMGDQLIQFLGWVFNLRGVSWTSFRLAQTAQQLVALACWWLLARGWQAPFATRAVSTLLLSLTIFTPVLFPWYNTWALMLELLSLALLAYSLHGRVPLPMQLAGVAGAGALAACVLYAKQDFGALLLGINAVLCWRWAHPRWASLLALGAGVAGGLAWVLPLDQWEAFSYWFNMGQPYQPKRLTLGRIRMMGWQAKYGVLAGLAVLLWRLPRGKARPLLTGSIFREIMVALMAQSVITTITSGMTVTHNYYLPAVALVALTLWQGGQLDLWARRAVLAGSLYFGLFLSAEIVASLALPRLPIFWMMLEARLRRNPLEPGRRDWTCFEQAPWQGLYFPEEFVKKWPRWQDSLDHWQGQPLLNLSELTPILVKGQPQVFQSPRVWPLWFDTTASHFPREQALVTAALLKGQFATVIYQRPHWHAGYPHMSRLLGIYDLVDSTRGACEYGQIYLLHRKEGSPSLAPAQP